MFLFAVRRIAAIKKYTADKYGRKVQLLHQVILSRASLKA